MALVIINIIFALCVVFVAYAQNFLNPFILWNLVPVIIGYFWLRWAVKKKSGEKGGAWPAIGYNVISAGIVLYLHIMWQINADGMATSSSTAGLIFIFIPMYALVGGLAGFLIALLAKKIYVKAVSN